MPEQVVNQPTYGISLSSLLSIFLGILISAFYLVRYPSDASLNLPNTEILKGEYDFIVVGAGSAGAVVANRLSENPNFKVLLLEAGGDETGTSETPALAGFLQMTEKDWNYTIESSPKFCLGMIDNSCGYPRGRMLGGSSALNYMLYVRGNMKDFDYWAEKGNYGWSFEDVLPYFKKSEDNQNPEFSKNKKFHSTNGELTVSDQRWTSPLAEIFVKAGVELGYARGDYNGENQTSFSIPQVTMRDGSRCSSSKAFLHPAAERDNLDIAKHAQVTKVLINPETKHAYGVQYFRNGVYHEVLSRKEIVLSSGALNSPQILMLSGIGPKDHLEEIGIPVIKDLPVGFNFQNHIGLPMIFTSEEPVGVTLETYESLFSSLSYGLFRNGPLTSAAGLEATGFVNTKYQDPEELFPDLQLFTFSMTAAADGGLSKKLFRINDELMETIFNPILSKPSFLFFVTLQRPKSVGRILLKSGNPFDPPIIRENYFDNQDDIRRIIDGGRFSLKLLETKPFQDVKAKYHYVPLPPCPDAQPPSDEYFECLMRYFTVIFYHGSGTVRMGTMNDPTAVVDPELRVHGISGLRVADTSIMPRIVSGNTNVPAIMIGEKASDMIKNSWD